MSNAAGRSVSHTHGADVRQRSFVFACEVVSFCERLYRAGGAARVLAPQLIRASTSVAGMLEEARAGESDRDFVSKCCIGLKECREAHVRLRICVACRLGPPTDATRLTEEANQLVAILTAIIRNKRRSMKPRRPIPNS
jgi:four helix bundle protein